MNNDTSKQNSVNNAEQLKPTNTTSTTAAQPTQPVQPTVSPTANATAQAAPAQPVTQTPTAQVSQPAQPTTQSVQNNQAPTQPAKPLTKKEAKRLAKEKAKQEKRAKSNFRYIMTIILFVLLFAFVFYLPEISHYINEKQYLKGDEEVITTGNLECTKKDNDKDYDYEYSNTFSFTNSKLTRLYFKTSTSGSLSKDLDHLEKIKDKCDNLKIQVKKLDGVAVKCDLDDKTVTVEQELNYVDIDVDKVTNAYVEAGGVYPNYKYNDNINKVEKDMKAAGYTCKRTR